MASQNEAVTEPAINDLFYRLEPQDVAEKWSKSPAMSQYLQEVSSLGWNGLLREPDRLQSEKAYYIEQTYDLAFENYKTFVTTAECSEKVINGCNEINKTIPNLTKHLDTFADKCRSFTKEAQTIVTCWHKTSHTLAKHPKLLTLLEIPQLMDSCVYAGRYDDVLELAAYVDRLMKRYQDVELMQKLGFQAQLCRDRLVSHLVHQLKTSGQLSECLRVIAYLRRMKVYSDTKLQEIYLNGRKHKFELQQPEKSFGDILQWMELHRVFFFDTITQFKAIFPLDDQSSCSRYVFSAWFVIELKSFLSTVENLLNSNLSEKDNLDVVLPQINYMSQSLCRVNCDLKALIIPVLQRFMTRIVEHSFEEISTFWNDSFDQFAISNLMINKPLMQYSTINIGDITVPTTLLEYSLIANCCNDILLVLNQIRQCCFMCLILVVKKKLEHFLRQIADALNRCHHLVSSNVEQEQFDHMCSIMIEDMVPFINDCLEKLFAPERLHETLAIPISAVKHLLDIDIENVFKPIMQFAANFKSKATFKMTSCGIEYASSEISMNESLLRAACEMFDSSETINIEDLPIEKTEKKLVGDNDIIEL